MTAFVEIVREGIFWRYYVRTSHGMVVQQSRRFLSYRNCILIAGDIADYYNVPLIGNNKFKGANNDKYGGDTAATQF